ncbi:DUF1934 domain-containing protein [Heyndrickxia acidiproducens]|uniref:DUF1934 domain-containing protein n=1 Tax=Heyndrickxia acidiproducens TaxID=1121084 RepID=UPI00039E0866|nr:DUF1934 domain-containing protein [Heyndrickxia acidiproducens]
MPEKDDSYPVKIQLSTQIFQEEQEKVEMILSGRYYEKGNAAYLKYDEVQEEGKVHTVVKISGSRALILRSGAIRMRLDLRVGEKRRSTYESRYGNFPMEAKATGIGHHRSGQAQGRFSLGYELFMQGNHLGTYNMAIHYEEVQEAR